MHVAPIGVAALGHQSVYRHRYWLAVGTEAQPAAQLDALWDKYSAETAELGTPGQPPL